MGWFGNILIVIGVVKIANKKRSGFIFNGLGELVWIGHAASQGLWDLVAICGVFCLLAVWSYRKWGAEQ